MMLIRVSCERNVLIIIIICHFDNCEKNYELYRFYGIIGPKKEEEEEEEEEEEVSFSYKNWVLQLDHTQLTCKVQRSRNLINTRNTIFACVVNMVESMCSSWGMHSLFIIYI